MTGAYANFIMAAYGITGIVLAALVIASFHTWTKVKKNARDE